MSTWSVPACPDCCGVGSDPNDGSECATCEGAGLLFLDAASAADRANVAKQFVQNWGAITAMTAVGFYLGVRDPRADLDAARTEWASVYRDAFGADPRRKVSVGILGVITLELAMRDAVAEAAVRFAVEGADPESEIDAMDIEAVRAPKPRAA